MPVKLLVPAGAFVVVAALLAAALAGGVLDGDGDGEPTATPALANERPNPFGTPDATESATAAAQQIATAEATSESEDGEGDGADSEPAAGAPEGLPAGCAVDSDGTVAATPISVGQILPLFATAEITGLGAAAKYVVYESCAGPAAYRYLRQGPEERRTIDQGGCSFAGSGASQLIGALFGTDAAAPTVPPSFQAAFRASQTEYFSIADDGANGFVNGGYSFGGPADGSAGGQQWHLFSEGRLDYGHYHTQRVRADDGVSRRPIWTEVDGYDVVINGIVAIWRGDAIENFTKEEAEGTVVIQCWFAFLYTEED